MNKYAIAMMYQNEALWLRLHLPFLVSESYDLIMLDGGSTDGSYEVACLYTQHVSYKKFANNFGNQANLLLQYGRTLGYNYILRLDPDELMFREHIAQCFAYAAENKYDVLSLPRFNFEGDRQHFCQHLYPDWQQRVINLQNYKIRYEGVVHEHPVGYNTIFSHGTSPIYHYEGLKPRAYVALKGINYMRLEKGLEPLEALPREVAEQEMRLRDNVLFEGPQPAIFKNVRAPY